MKLFTAALLFGVAHLGIAYADSVKNLWPKKPYKHVVAYCYNPFYDTRGTPITFDDGSLHAGVIRATTVRLDEAQTLKLREILSTDTNTSHGGVLCYYPHHAFVFYDAEWKVVSSIDICFLCDDYKCRPKGVSESVDLAAMKTFCSQIGLPILKNSSDYTNLFYQELPPKPNAEKKEGQSGTADRSSKSTEKTLPPVRRSEN